jgi:hypothetical protein
MGGLIGRRVILHDSYLGVIVETSETSKGVTMVRIRWQHPYESGYQLTWATQDEIREES